MVYLKNAILIVFAFIIAFAAVEFFVVKIFGYPRWGVDKQIFGIKPYGKMISEIYLPNSEYSNFENGFNVYKRNNLGLNGCFLDTSSSNKVIFLLGDSYIQATQIAPEYIASSILQSKLKKKSFIVMNLAQNGADPYYMYYQSLYYSEKFNPGYVILILSHSYMNWLNKRYEKLDFVRPKDFGSKKNAWLFSDKEIKLCNTSSLFYILSLLLKNNKAVENNLTLLPNNTTSIVSDKLKSCIEGFYDKYEEKFILISIFDDISFNNAISNFCKERNIKFFNKNINIKENKINGNGHLSEKGNSELANYLYEVVTIAEHE